MGLLPHLSSASGYQTVLVALGLAHVLQFSGNVQQVHFATDLSSRCFRSLTHLAHTLKKANSLLAPVDEARESGMAYVQSQKGTFCPGFFQQLELNTHFKKAK